HSTSAVSITFLYTGSVNATVLTLSLPDALPICVGWSPWRRRLRRQCTLGEARGVGRPRWQAPPYGVRARRDDEEARGRRQSKGRSEEHTSELQSRGHLVCRVLLEKIK